MLKIKYILIILACLLMCNLSNLNAQNRDLRFHEIKRELIKNITTENNIYDMTNNIGSDASKIELFFEAMTNSNDNPEHCFVTLNQFKYHENKVLYKSIRDADFFLMLIPIDLNDNDYDFENNKFTIFRNSENHITINNGGMNRKTFYLSCHHSLHFSTPINIAKSFSEDKKLTLLLLFKNNGWGVEKEMNLSYYLYKEIDVLKVEIVKSFLINGSKNKFLAGIPQEITRDDNKTDDSNDRIYQLAPRGGCYYLNKEGKKVFVDRSFCR